MVAGRVDLKYIYFIKFGARGQDAVSISHHCANTNVGSHFFYEDSTTNNRTIDDFELHDKDGLSDS